MKPRSQIGKYDVLVGISSGVDSTYALYYIKSQGKRPLALLLFTGYNFSAIEKAKNICTKLDVDLKIEDISDNFNRLVVEKIKSLYNRGITPNPCVICNQEIKFSFLFQIARKLSIPFIATGHYSCIENNRLKEAKSKRKDQTYFLYTLLNQDLSKILFPLCNKEKEEIWGKMEKLFPSLFEKESQDLCFIKKNYRKELFGESAKPGPIYDPTGERVGTHNGIWNYTIGQREGISIKKTGPWYVYNIDSDQNAIFIGPKSLTEKEQIIFLLEAPKKLNNTKTNVVLQAKIRYNQEKLLVKKIVELGKNKVKVVFHKKAFAPTPGQAIVLYEGEYVFAGGTILR